MRRVTEKEVKEEKRLAEKIKEEYAYMDNMPFEGWMWEIIRRSERYKRNYDFLKQYASQIDDNGNLIQYEWKEEDFLTILGKPMADCIVSIRETGVLGIFFGSYKLINPDQYILFICPGSWTHYPNYEIKFVDFPENIKPSIWGLEPLEVFTLDTFTPPGKAFELYERAISDLIIMKCKNKICVTISKSANIKDIEKTLFTAIKKYLKPRKIKTRDDKWRYYLIVYDLKKEYGFSSEVISNILHEAYPEIPEITIQNGKKRKKMVDSSNFFTARNCDNYYKSALALLDGDYKKYLYL